MAAHNNGWALRPAAEADLAEIWQQGATRWGMAQADRYADGLFALFDLLARFPEMAPERREITPPVRVHASGAHLVIYRRGTDHEVEIIRILHAHQNLMALLQDG
ncbi:MAG: type II toxin-antitoxin system RelE/ParE family toxin [Gemmobacter sp.]|uniref:type II toxin-antitoxin system RelE/ParE family toxin n=1 Tax=Gemmobacter sp. TaxID=1898957 RepID=UPI001A3B9124|nr:type II toxin-antitoxin system RelE/ParE family toxin [Gemmobacter sp.]MBL8563215.1 type II toxin-antitoxin system RelE/ParE family toxin [Gemmobacter sp.]